MKIVFLAPFGIRPKGTVLARMVPLAAELQRLGHELTIIAPPYTNPEDSGREETVCGVRLVNIRLAEGWKPSGETGAITSSPLSLKTISRPAASIREPLPNPSCFHFSFPVANSMQRSVVSSKP